jgi:type IX secretion system PorP/SprF family membrane protein
MKKRNTYLGLIVILLLSVSLTKVHAQQELNYTQYMYNPLRINPAYAGSKDGLDLFGLVRSQWVGLENGPEQQAFSVHGKLGSNLGLGVSIVNESVFVTRRTFLSASLSYTLNFRDSKLAFGINAGGDFFDLNFSKANGSFTGGDPALSENVQNQFSPQIGVGLYYYTDYFYFGLSIPRLLKNDHFNEDSVNSPGVSYTAEDVSQYHLMGGYVFDLNQDIKFKPSALLTLITGAPISLNTSVNFLFYDKLTLGAGYQWDASVSALVALKATKSLMLGFAYDKSTTKLEGFNNGTFEVFLKLNFGNRFF